MPTTITTPSGLAGEVRGLSGRDGRFLTDLKVSRANLIPDYILKSCWSQTTAAGIYKLEKSSGDLAVPDWSKCLVGDRDYTLIQIRIESYGEKYTFNVHCQNPTCRDRFEWDIDLKALPVKKLSKKDRETFLGGNRFTTTIPDTDRGVVFKLVTGGDIHRASALRKELKGKSRSRQDAESNLLVESILMRIVDVDGITEKHPVRKRDAIRSLLEDADMRQLAELLDRFDEHDCGVETTIAVDCPTCEREQDIPLPFEGDFFFPRKSSRVVGSTKRTSLEQAEMMGLPTETEGTNEEAEDEEPQSDGTPSLEAPDQDT